MHVDAEVYLEHYGVKGMKWGVRTGIKSNSKDVKRGEIKGIYRTPKSGKTQTRGARLGKRIVASILLPGIGGMAYNTIARPLNPTSAKTIRNQSKLAYGAKTALSLLGGPIGALQYQQQARPIGPKDRSLGYTSQKVAKRVTTSSRKPKPTASVS